MRLTHRIRRHAQRAACARFWRERWYILRDAPWGLLYPRLLIFWLRRPALYFRLRAIQAGMRLGLHSFEA